MAGVAFGFTASYAYASRQPHVYESTATQYIRLSQKSVRGANQGVISGELGLLTYGSLVNTLVSIAQSRSTLSRAATGLGVPPDLLRSYHAIVTVRPQSFVLDISLDGPNRKLVVTLATKLALTLGRTAAAEFPVFGLSSLASPSAPIQVRPRLHRDLVYGGVVGLILGLVLSVLRVSSSSAQVATRRSDDHSFDGTDSVRLAREPQSADPEAPASEPG